MKGRDGSFQDVVVTSFGDSIAAGYCGFPLCQMDSYVKYFAYKNAESIASTFNVNIQGRGRAVSGYTSDNILHWIDEYYQDVVDADVITIDACGNDFLPARKDFRSSCDEGRLASALQICKTNIAGIYDKILGYAKPGAVVRVMNLYYPDLKKDRAENCNGKSNLEHFMKTLAEANYAICEMGRARGIACADAFAEMNISDENRTLVAWVPGESLEDYRTRILANLDLLSDPSQKLTSQGVVSLIQDDDMHPNEEGHRRIGALHHALGYAPSK